MAGFEPAVSCSRGHRREAVVGGLPDFPTPEIESAQRELNPRFRHGKTVGFRYIMGACLNAELSKIKSTGRESNPRCRLTSAESCRWATSACIEWDRRGSNPHQTG
jgi:hypothetical protein